MVKCLKIVFNLNFLNIFLNLIALYDNIIKMKAAHVSMEEQPYDTDSTTSKEFCEVGTLFFNLVMLLYISITFF